LAARPGRVPPHPGRDGLDARRPGRRGRIPAAARTTRDYRVLDPLAIALLRLGRADEAASVVETLRAMGYRDPVFLAQIQTTGAV
jgi:hypothetical protein